VGIDRGYSGPQLIKFLLANVKCVVCQHRYELSDIQAIEQRDHVWLIAVTCSYCGTQGVILAMVEEVEGPELAEFTPEEWVAFQQMPPIDADEVLNMHEFLRDFEGDFEKLLTRPHQRGKVGKDEGWES